MPYRRILLLAVLPSIGFACSGDHEHPPPLDKLRATDKTDVFTSLPCETGQRKACGIQVEARAGVVSCYRGEQVCDNGTWSGCSNGTLLNLSLHEQKAPFHSRSLALSTPVACSDAPCDPLCQKYVEQPAAPIQALPGDPLYKWQTGSLGALPRGLVRKGFQESCTTASSCQFNTYCSSPNQGNCSHSVCLEGVALAAECSECAAAVCASDASCCTGNASSSNWAQSCVELVATKCGAVCNANDPSSSTGVCEPWYPGMKKSHCEKADLSIGAPCEGSIPVCNHGVVAAPAGIRVVHFPANSMQYPKCAPDLSHPQMVECLTKAPIEPGHCINMTDCAGLIGNRELMVNPTSTSALDECDCRDNWSVYSGGSCSSPICSGGSSASTVINRPVDIIFVIDNSSSMTEEIVAIQDLIGGEFAQYIADSGVDYRIIVVSRFGDVSQAVGDSDHPICIKKPLGGNDCLSPSTEPLILNPPRFFHYSANVESTNAWCLLLDSYLASDEALATGRDWTPLAPSGWSEWLRPNAFKAFVVVTDDSVACSSSSYSFFDKGTALGGETAATAFDRALRALDPSQFGTAALRNYAFYSIVGMAANSPTSSPWPPSAAIMLNRCGSAATGAGTGYQALSRLTQGLRFPSCNTAEYLSALRAFRERVLAHAAASCSYMLPENSSAYDPSSLTVTYTSLATGIETQTKLTRVAGAQYCTANNWYYDNPLAPSSMVLCPQICSTIGKDLTARVVVELGCPRPRQTSVTTTVYTGTCDAASANIWLDLGYQATVPGDGRIDFRARVAATREELASASYTPIGKAGPTTASCPLGSACAIDVFSQLGEASAKHPYLELEITVVPSTAGASPLLGSYQLTFSCLNNR